MSSLFRRIQSLASMLQHKAQKQSSSRHVTKGCLLLFSVIFAILVGDAVTDTLLLLFPELWNRVVAQWIIVGVFLAFVIIVMHLFPESGDNISSNASSLSGSFNVSSAPPAVTIEKQSPPVTRMSPSQQQQPSRQAPTLQQRPGKREEPRKPNAFMTMAPPLS